MEAPTRRVLSLKDPTSKMSKSAQDPNSRILLTDPPSLIASKIRSAVTDSIQGISYDPIDRPGTSNLLNILAACLNDTAAAEGREGEIEVEEVAKRYEGKNHGELKRDVVDAIVERFRGPREEFERLRGERGYLESVARRGAERARERSEETVGEVRRRVGLA